MALKPSCLFKYVTPILVVDARLKREGGFLRGTESARLALKGATSLCESPEGLLVTGHNGIHPILLTSYFVLS